MAQLVEHILGKDEVISSNLITSSRSPVGLTPAGIFLCLEGGGLQKIFCPVYPPLDKICTILYNNSTKKLNRRSTCNYQKYKNKSRRHIF